MLMKEIIYTLEHLKDKCAEWQSILRLQDWDIEISIVRQRGMGSRTSMGECEYNEQRKIAFIRILDPIDYEDLLPLDMEWTLVHELLHLHFAPIWDDDKESEMETTINLLAAALVRMYRRD